MPQPSDKLTPAEHDELTTKAILARFGGDRDKARRYCVTVATDYVLKNRILSAEYWHYAECFRI